MMGFFGRLVRASRNNIGGCMAPIGGCRVITRRRCRMIAGSKCRVIAGSRRRCIGRRLVVATGLLGHFGTSLLFDRVATGLRLVACTCMGYLSALLPGHIIADLPGNLSLHFVLHSLAVLLRVVPGHLSIFSVTFLSVFSGTALLGNLLTFLSWHILALLLWHILAVLSWHLLTHLSRLCVALLAGDNRGHGFLHLLALAHWNWTAYWFVYSGALLIILIISVGDLNGLAVLLGHINTVLLRDLLAGSSRFIPALLPRFVPAFLLTIFIAALFLYNSGAFPLSGSGAFLFIAGAALSVSDGFTLLFVPVFSNWFLDSLATLFRRIMTLFLSD